MYAHALGYYWLIITWSKWWIIRLLSIPQKISNEGGMEMLHSSDPYNPDVERCDDYNETFD